MAHIISKGEALPQQQVMEGASVPVAGRHVHPHCNSHAVSQTAPRLLTFFSPVRECCTQVVINCLP